jgi:hypothetical protein
MSKYKIYKTGDLEAIIFVENSGVTKESMSNNGLFTAKEFVEDSTITMPLKMSATQCICKGQLIEPEIVYDMENNDYTVVRIDYRSILLV